ncbi:RNB domain-containing ribonuclease [Sphingomonas aliaeris]|uniref:RNB domain-containing ribonuclease n=1 Tax=Sphingomonas aliaeris TaxID=2759526 RepID=A0A974NSU1_9SPHN|nr:RNB domain-containing ribonuclease [Sphingomonas aliaeris]QQV76275.1 RNB domain-containing ribonuclease [Sphingomonas aliaeris]
MKTLIDPDLALAPGLAAIRAQFSVPTGFSPEVLAAAEAAAARPLSEHADRTDMPFVTLDPASSTDLDQAFTIERSGNDLVLRYAIADVAWFVDDGGAIDIEAWKRGTTLYLPDGKASLYPPVLSEKAASLLPKGPRAAVIFTVRVGPDGTSLLDGAERAVIRNRAKLAYDSVQAADLPPDFAAFSVRMAEAEARRGASRVDPPQQEVEAVAGGGYRLTFAPRLASEDSNAALSLATNLAVATALQEHHTGLFRVMAGPDDRAVARLRQMARGLGLTWPDALALTAFEPTLDAADPAQAAFMVALRRAGSGASYMPYHERVVPWHAAMAATYAHATAPLRRLADRYVVQAALAIANGQAVPDVVTQAFETLPPVMARADAIGGRIDRAVIDLAEAVMLHGREGEVFPAVIVDADDRGAHIQLRDLAVLASAKVTGRPGDVVDVRLVKADVEARTLGFEAA